MLLVHPPEPGGPVLTPVQGTKMKNASFSGRLETHKPSGVKQSGGTTHTGRNDSQTAPLSREGHTCWGTNGSCCPLLCSRLRVPVGSREAQTAQHVFSSQQWCQGFQCERSAAHSASEFSPWEGEWGPWLVGCQRPGPEVTAGAAALRDMGASLPHSLQLRQSLPAVKGSEDRPSPCS